MTTSFDPTNGLIVISAEIWGPAGSAILRLAFDTGATRTLVNPALLTALGYDTALSHTRIEITTGSGVEYAALVEIQSIYALDQTVLRFPVVAHTLPPSSGIDGLPSAVIVFAGFLSFCLIRVIDPSAVIRESVVFVLLFYLYSSYQRSLLMTHVLKGGGIWS